MKVRQTRSLHTRPAKAPRLTRQTMEVMSRRHLAWRSVRDSFALAGVAAILAFLLADVTASIAHRIGVPEVFAYLAVGIPVPLLVVGAFCEVARLWLMARREKSGHRG